MKRKIINIFILMLLLNTSIKAGLDDRKGFVYGAGLDLAPYAKFSTIFAEVELEKKTTAFGFQIFAGYAWNKSNMLVLELHGTSFKEKYELNEPYKIVKFDRTVFQNYFGPMWYHYFGVPGKAFFTALGAGTAMSENPLKDFNPDGFGVLVGAGGEFMEHWQAGIYFFKGRSPGTTNPDTEEYDLSFISLCITRFEY